MQAFPLRPHRLATPIPLYPVEAIMPGIDLDGIPSLLEVQAGVVPIGNKFGSREYRNFIRRPYVMLCMDWERPDPQFIRGREMLECQIIVDLGPGISLDGYNLACSVGAEAYIGVEPYHTAKLIDRFHTGQEPEEIFESVPLRGDMIPAAIVCDHAARFLGRLPDRSVSMIVSGLDRQILPSQEYHDQLAAEIERTLHPSGVCLRSCSWLEPRNLACETVSAGDGLYYLYRPRS